MAKYRGICHRAKHISIKYHRLRRFVDDGTIVLNSIHIKEQTSDIFTKTLEEMQSIDLMEKLCGT